MSGASDFFGWQLLQDQLSNDANFTIDLAKEIGKSYCRIQQKYPVRNRLITNPMGLPIIDFCSQAGVPPAAPVPPPPFEGGQCQGVNYKVEIQYDYIPGGTQDRLTRIDLLSTGLSGPITQIDTLMRQNSTQIRSTIHYYPPGNQTTKDTSASGIGFIFEESIKYILTRKDGQPDNCGSPPPNYPPDPLPDDNDFSQTFNYSYETNEGDIITNEYTINYDNSDGSDFYFPIVGFIADVDFNVDIEFNLDLGGITINRRGGGGSGSGSGGGDYGDNLPAPNEDNSEETQTDDEEKIFIKQPKPPEEESQDTGLERLDYITINIIQKPSNAPRQDGTPGDDIYFPGFAEFKSGGYNYPRVPLHFERNILRAPDGADGYAVRFYPGYKGQITVYTRKETS